MKECNHSVPIIPALSAIQATGIHHSHTATGIEYNRPEDAVVYVTVVIVFYAAIIMFLIGSNIHRRRGHKVEAEDGFRYEEFMAQREAILENERKARKVQTGSKQFKLFKLDEHPVLSEV